MGVLIQTQHLQLSNFIFPSVLLAEHIFAFGGLKVDRCDPSCEWTFFTRPLINSHISVSGVHFEWGCTSAAQALPYTYNWYPSNWSRNNLRQVAVSLHIKWKAACGFVEDAKKAVRGERWGRTEGRGRGEGTPSVHRFFVGRWRNGKGRGQEILWNVNLLLTNIPSPSPLSNIEIR